MTTLGTREHDNLFAGSSEVVIGSAIAGEALTRGTVVGAITDSGKVVAVDSSLSDGSEKPYAIVADDVEIDKPVTIYFTGEFNENVLTFGGTDEVATHKRALRDVGIFLNENIGE